MSILAVATSFVDQFRFWSRTLEPIVAPKSPPPSPVKAERHPGALDGESWEGRTCWLNPRLIDSSDFCRPAKEDAKTVDFKRLEESIRAIGGNIKPIKVRVMTRGTATQSDETSDWSTARFEVVYGNRRYEACLRLGIPILATIERMTSKDAFIEMFREGSAGGLPVVELGRSCDLALQRHLFRDRGSLKQAVGVTSEVDQAIFAFANYIFKEFMDSMPSKGPRWIGPAMAQCLLALQSENSTR